MPFRINVRKTKALLWLLAMTAFLASGWTFYDVIYMGKKQGRYESKGAEHFREALMREVDGEVIIPAGPITYDELEVLWEARLDGSRKPRPEDLAPTEVEDSGPATPVLRPLEEVLDVSLIMWSSEPLERLVAVVYKDDRNTGGARTKEKRLHLAEGETLQSPYDEDPYFGRVAQIDTQTVTFQWGEEEIRLTPGLGRDGEGVPMTEFSLPLTDDPLAGLEEMPEESVEVTDDVWILGTKDRQEMSERGHEMLTQEISVRTIAPQRDKRTMIEITNVSSDSMAGKLGFKSGDRIISVNGIPMPSIEAAVNWYKANSDQPAYVIRYERLGQNYTTTIHAGDVPDTGS